MASKTPQYDNLSQDQQNTVNNAIWNKVMSLQTEDMIGKKTDLTQAASASLSRSLLTDNGNEIRKDDPEYARQFVHRQPDIDPKLAKVMADFIVKEKNDLSSPDKLVALQAAESISSYKHNIHEQRTVNNTVIAYSDVNKYEGDPNPGLPIRSGEVEKPKRGGDVGGR